MGPRVFPARAAALLALASLLSLPSAGAVAAPQILNLIATAGPRPLVCEDGVCRAE